LFSRAALEHVLRKGVHSRAHFFQTEIKTYCHDLKFAQVPIQYEAASPRMGTKALKDAFIHLRRLHKTKKAKQIQSIYF